MQNGAADGRGDGRRHLGIADRLAAGQDMTFARVRSWIEQGPCVRSWNS